MKSVKRGKSVLSERFLASPIALAEKIFPDWQKTFFSRIDLSSRVWRGTRRRGRNDDDDGRLHVNACCRVRRDGFARRCMTLVAARVGRSHLRLDHPPDSIAKRATFSAPYRRRRRDALRTADGETAVGAAGRGDLQPIAPQSLATAAFFPASIRAGSRLACRERCALQRRLLCAARAARVVSKVGDAIVASGREDAARLGNDVDRSAPTDFLRRNRSSTRVSTDRLSPLMRNARSNEAALTGWSPRGSRNKRLQKCKLYLQRFKEWLGLWQHESLGGSG